MKTKHTPGPWLVRYNSVTTALNLKIVDGNEAPICEFPDPIYSNERNGIKSERESIANAHLIAAAPTLLETMEACIAMLDHKRDADAIVIRAMKNAIAKAKGEK